MPARIENPAMSVPGALEALKKFGAAATAAGIPDSTRQFVWLRASQINGCSVCVDMHARALGHAGEPNERIVTVAAWSETPYFTDAERAALALAEAATRLPDRPDPVSDQVWAEAARHYNEEQLAALMVSIAEINAWNRLMVATRQLSGEWVERIIGEPQPS